MDLFADVPGLPTYLGTVTASDGTALVHLVLARQSGRFDLLGAVSAAGGIAALVYGLSAAVPSGAFDVSHWAGAKVIAALAGAGYHPGRRPTKQMCQRCLH